MVVSWGKQPQVQRFSLRSRRRRFTGHERAYVPVVAGNVVLRLIGFFVLIPWLGVLGAALSATVSLTLATVALNMLCRRWTGVDPSILVLFRRPSWKTKPAASPATEPKI